jgi:hypothetical protein
MNMKVSQPAPITSADLHDCQAIRVLADQVVCQRTCLALNCTANWTYLINARDVQDRYIEAILGSDILEIVNCKYGLNTLALCRKHYKWIRTRDGFTLGYRIINGRTRAYVKEEYF